MMLLATTLLALQAAPAAAGDDIAATYDCRVLRSREEVRCEMELAVPPYGVSDSAQTIQYECLYSAHRLNGRCIPRSAPPVDPVVRARVTELIQSVETASSFFQMFNMPGGPEMKVTFRIPINPEEPSTEGAGR